MRPVRFAVTWRAGVHRHRGFAAPGHVAHPQFLAVLRRHGFQLCCAGMACLALFQQICGTGGMACVLACDLPSPPLGPAVWQCGSQRQRLAEAAKGRELSCPVVLREVFWKVGYAKCMYVMLQETGWESEPFPAMGW